MCRKGGGRRGGWCHPFCYAWMRRLKRGWAVWLKFGGQQCLAGWRSISIPSLRRLCACFGWAGNLNTSCAIHVAACEPFPGWSYEVDGPTTDGTCSQDATICEPRVSNHGASWVCVLADSVPFRVEYVRSRAHAYAQTHTAARTLAPASPSHTQNTTHTHTHTHTGGRRADGVRGRGTDVRDGVCRRQ